MISRNINEQIIQRTSLQREVSVYYRKKKLSKQFQEEDRTQLRHITHRVAKSFRFSDAHDARLVDDHDTKRAE